MEEKKSLIQTSGEADADQDGDPAEPIEDCDEGDDDQAADKTIKDEEEQEDE